MNFQAKDSGITLLVQSGGTDSHAKAKKVNKATTASATDDRGHATVQIASTPDKPTKSEPSSTWPVLLLFAILVLYAASIIYRLSKKIIKVFKYIRGDVEEADYTVPHCNFKETPEGFKVTFRRLPIWLQERLYNEKETTKNRLSRNRMGLLGMLLSLIAANLFLVPIAMLYSLWSLVFPTRITITGELVIINGKKLYRKDFSSFHIYHTKNVYGKEEALAQLGYQYGNRSFKFGGGWNDRDAHEVSAALNAHLRSAPTTGTESAPSQEALRQTLQSDETF